MTEYADAPEYKVTVPCLHGGTRMMIRLDKTGGGTIGCEYTGDWECTLKIGGVLYIDTMTTGMPKTHVEAARIFASSQAEALAGEIDPDLIDDLEIFAYGLD